MDNFLAVQTLIIVLLLVVSLVAIAVRRLRIPYTVALVLVVFADYFSAAAEYHSDIGTDFIYFCAAFNF